MTGSVVADKIGAKLADRDRLADARHEREQALRNQLDSLMSIVDTFIHAGSVTVSASRYTKDLDDATRRDLLREASESLYRAQGWLRQIVDLLVPDEPPF